MRPIAICAIFSAFLISACTGPDTPPAASVWHTIEPNLVRDWCGPGEASVVGSDGWVDCSAVTHEDAKRLGGHKTLVDRKRAE